MDTPIDIAARMGAEVPTLREAVVMLYPQLESGLPDTDFPVWPWCEARGIRQGRRVLGVETRTAGYLFPRRVALSSVYTISIQKLWLPPRPPNLENPIPTGPMVLDIVWTDEASGNWRRRVYNGVSLESHDSESGADGMESVDSLVFIAETMDQTQGLGAAPLPDLVDTFYILNQTGGRIILASGDGYLTSVGGSTARGRILCQDGGSIILMGGGILLTAEE